MLQSLEHEVVATTAALVRILDRAADDPPSGAVSGVPPAMPTVPDPVPDHGGVDSPEMPRDVVAYHEAGHAVAACLLKCRFGRVSILPEAGSHRRVSLAQARARVLTEGYSAALDGLRGRVLIEHQAMFALAGAVATAIREERPVDWGESEEDSRTARGWIEELTDDEDEVDAYLKWLSARTRVLLGRPRSWAAVTALAQTLLERGQLGGWAARAVIRQAIDD